ncbi:hypothetical protein QAD02_014182 [Eretmocerus hayati]|uniref:Uncharacterized protein n=1 Tax=Eretmocerus hayati TaxID=131215 RepID=A0ACC2P4S7_9HYME|nr:hypothetical protein QAD02_014182 [Eretmocerus hayati]
MKVSAGCSNPPVTSSGILQPPKKSAGRPRRRKCNFVGGGRKKKQKGEAMSVSRERTLAREIFKGLWKDHDHLVVQRVFELYKKKERKDQELLKNTAFAEKKKSVTRHTEESALAFYLERRFSKHHYSAMVKDHNQRSDMKRGQNIYPSYKVVSRAKKKCLPAGIQVSEREVFTPLQDLANKTAERLCESVARGWSRKALKKVKLVCSGGFDSSSGHSNSHQKCANPENEINDATQSLFVTSMSPLQLVSESDTNTGEYKWCNSTPLSYRYCRPVRIACEKETKEAILQEYNRMKSEVDNLHSHTFKMANGKDVEVIFEFHLTMFDVKCVSTILEVPATQRCPTCARTTHEFGNKDLSFFVEDNNKALDLGIALLHAEMKMFKHLLHLSYRLNIEVWAVSLQYKGFVQDLADILILFKPKKRVDYTLLEDYCWRVYWQHYELYPWSHMNVSIHKLLMHDCQVAKKLPLPVCYFSEDSQEAWHKFYRRNMVEHARQYSKEAQLSDVYNRAIYDTDPLISNILLEERSQYLVKKIFTERLNGYLLKRYNSILCPYLLRSCFLEHYILT